MIRTRHGVMLLAPLALVLAGFFLFLQHTRLGIWMRAVRHDRETAIAMGIPAGRVYVMTFGIGFALAAFGGAVAYTLLNKFGHDAKLNAILGTLVTLLLRLAGIRWRIRLPMFRPKTVLPERSS